jgi:hypothetical protein
MTEKDPIVKEELKDTVIQESCFDFYEKLENMSISDLQFKKDFKYTMVHPY